MMTKTALAGLAIGLALAAPAVGAAELAPAGAQLALGDSAVVPLRIPYGPQVPVRVTVTAIDEGTLADFDGFKLPPAAADMKPYYVRYSVTALGNGNLSGLGLGYTLAVDDRNQLHTSSLAQSISPARRSIDAVTAPSRTALPKVRAIKAVGSSCCTSPVP